MPDYASILRRSVAALPDPTAEMREAVYQRARAALARQLTAVDPPLSTREIENQHQELEDAVARLESEFAPQSHIPEPVTASSFATATRKDDFLYSAPQPPPPERRQAAPPRNDFVEAAAADSAFEEGEDEDFADDDRPSRIPLVIALVCVVLVILGAGAFGYSQRETLFNFISSKAGPDAVATADTPQTDTAAADAEADKRPDRLSNGPDAPPPAETAAAEPAPVPVPAPATAAAAPTPAPDSATVASTTPSDETQLSNLAGIQSPANASLEEPATSLVEQRAIYYFQGAEGQAGQASEGTATWSEITKDNHPAIQAMIHIAERNVTVTVTIYKNYDSTLPASHLVEVQFSSPLSDSPILRVPALVLKQTEQARGQPLAGAAVPVTNELFWIALSNTPEESARNVQLLSEGSWFDIPILFNDQTRALITFEKGIPGDKVFETVMASWTPA